ncbi:MAG: alkaline phosphatase family protein [Lachnospiraceae bacterium]|nr:alkaline phosphatase family protein [Lachnospiraceae bacterium]
MNKKKLPIHLIFLGVLALIVVLIVLRIRNWGTRIDLGSVRTFDNGEFDTEVYDNIMPVTDENGYILRREVKRILFFGNDPLTADLGKKDSLASLIAEGADAEVINLAIPGSYLCSEDIFEFEGHPMDVFTPYVLAQQLYGNDMQVNFDTAARVMQDALPDRAREVWETVKTLDLNTVDVVAFYYDDTDYLLDHQPYDPEVLTNIRSCSGNLAATVLLLREKYPHLRFIVMGTHYCYHVGDHGKYEDAELYPNSYESLAGYSLWLYSVCSDRLGISFVDNYYGTITGENASKYLSDERHVNRAGRKLLRDRFLYALRFYDHWETEEGA